MFFRRVYASPLAHYLLLIDYQLNSLTVTTTNGSVTTIEKNENELYYIYDEHGRVECDHDEVIQFYGCDVTTVQMCTDEY